jgi:putative aldouronate transport system permease protein
MRRGKKAYILLDQRRALWRRIVANRYFYLMFLPVAIIYILFAYVPMYGIQLAFKELNFAKGITRSPWAAMHGLKHFYDLLSNQEFLRAFRNTLVISVQRIVFEFPVPIILALLINEMRRLRLRKVYQTIFTFPHFLSWVVVTGVFINLLSNAGVLNELLELLGGQRLSLLTQQSTFRTLLYVTDNWKEAGWGTVIYLAAISGVNVELYEAAIVDGAKRKHLVRYITWPAIVSVIGVMLILSLSNIMNAGFDQVFNMYNAAVRDKVDIIDTFIYRRTFITGLDFASSTAVGLFKSVINFIMLFAGNEIVRRVTGRGFY